MHPWHDIAVDPDTVETLLPVVIEIPSGSKNKYELDKASGILKLDRVLYARCGIRRTTASSRGASRRRDPWMCSYSGGAVHDDVMHVGHRVMRMRDQGKIATNLAVHAPTAMDHIGSWSRPRPRDDGIHRFSWTTRAGRKDVVVDVQGREPALR